MLTSEGSNPPTPRTSPTADAILQRLSERQFVRPHSTLEDVLTTLAIDMELSATVVNRAVEWLKLMPNRAIGRLRRSELAQLSSCLVRFTEQAAPPVQPVGASTLLYCK